MTATIESQERPSGGQPAIILVAPQLAENIGMAARAMANFGLSELRLVAPRDGWPKKGARSAASGASPILDRAVWHPGTREAVADLTFVLATTRRERDQMKRVMAPDEAMAEVRRRAAAGERTGILFGRERIGLTNDEVALADAIVTFPVDPAFPSLNLAQAVLLIGYEWFRLGGAPLRFSGEARTPPASRESLVSFFEALEAALDEAGHFAPDKRAVMARNLRDVLIRREFTEQDVRTLRGALRALVTRRKSRVPDPRHD